MSRQTKHRIIIPVTALMLAAIVLYFFGAFVVKQDSMQPTLQPENRLIVHKHAYMLGGEPERGDIVICWTRFEDDEGNIQKAIKRVIGIPGDRIRIDEGYVYVNDERIEETYLKKQGSSGEMEEITVTPGSYFLMGDNREVSIDSRSEKMGTIARKDILGKAALRIWPFNEITKF